eukprot:TRINITY_DN2746_c0_g1_i9.p1 TRINITY_DN2746_c0_g1~~TRINITY_DN2746_c0_g1_i9.p1  ORF type:complete len:534 (-),score=90.15 TRINITY_DN2746_c0_g1_i9:270-1871(-)
MMPMLLQLYTAIVILGALRASASGKAEQDVALMQVSGHLERVHHAEIQGENCKANKTEILDALKGRDALMQGVLLESQTKIVLIDPGDEYWAYPNETYSEPNPTVIHAVYNTSLASEGHVVSMQRELQSDHSGSDAVPLAFQKWTKAGSGSVTELSKNQLGLVPPSEIIVDMYPSGSGADDVVEWQRFGVELVHGYGLGSRIDCITSVSCANGMWKLKGTLVVAGSKNVAFTAYVDSDYVVRKAVIRQHSDGALRTLTTTAEGCAYVEDIGIVLATRGTLHMSVQGNSTSAVVDEWTSSFCRARKLSQSKFEKFSSISYPDGATVMDWGKKGTGSMSSVSHEHAASRTPPPTWTPAPTWKPQPSPPPTPPPTAEKCPKCTAGWITQQDIFGGLECEHGPEHDGSAACVAAIKAGNIICKENDPKNGNCECFKCGRITCEGEIRLWKAWCGPKALKDDDCKTKPGAIGDLRQNRRASTPGGKPCDGAKGGFVSVEYCGPPSMGSSGASLACKASNCVGAGGWTTVARGRRLDCA